jgi:hypothetical protein
MRATVSDRAGVMERERVPKEWINRRVLVALRNERGGTYAVLGRLREVTDEEIRIVMRSSGRVRTFSWDSVAEVHPLGDRASR